MFPHFDKPVLNKGLVIRLGDEVVMTGIQLCSYPNTPRQKCRVCKYILVCNLLWSALCLGNQHRSQREPDPLPEALPCGHLSQGQPANVHINQNCGKPKNISHTCTGAHSDTLDMKIPSCEALPPRMLKPSCAPGGFFNTMVRGRN